MTTDEMKELFDMIAARWSVGRDHWTHRIQTSPAELGHAYDALGRFPFDRAVRVLDELKGERFAPSVNELTNRLITAMGAPEGAAAQQVCREHGHLVGYPPDDEMRWQAQQSGWGGKGNCELHCGRCGKEFHMPLARALAKANDEPGPRPVDAQQVAEIDAVAP